MKFEFNRLGIEIIIESNFILLKPPRELELGNILMSIAMLFTIPEFQEKNDIWLLREGQSNILYSDLDKIKYIAEIYHPKSDIRRKTAIVVNDDIQLSLAVLYSDMGIDLPREISIFRELKSAKQWVIEE